MLRKVKNVNVNYLLPLFIKQCFLFWHDMCIRALHAAFFLRRTITAPADGVLTRQLLFQRIPLRKPVAQ